MSLSKLITIFVVSFLPIAEVRGGIPLAFTFFYNDTDNLVIGIAMAMLGNLLIAPFVLYALKYVDIFIRGSNLIPKRIKGLYLWVLEYVRRKASKLRKYDVIALATFVAIPFPITGAWTGSLIAFLVGMDRKRALIAIELGVIAASLIVTSTCLLGLTVLRKIFFIP